MSDIEAVLLHFGAEHVPSGGSWRAMRCPFHEDRTASAQVNHHLGRFRCFGCDIYGDALGVIHRHEGVDFGEARRRLEGIAGGGHDALPAAGASRSFLPGMAGPTTHRGGFVSPRDRGGPRARP